MVMPGPSSFDRLLAQLAIAPRIVLLTPRLGMGSRTEVENVDDATVSTRLHRWEERLQECLTADNVPTKGSSEASVTPH